MTDTANCQTCGLRGNHQPGIPCPLPQRTIWYGGMGHRLLSTDDGGHQCFRCGMVADGGIDEEREWLIPDCGGPGQTGHYWIAKPLGIECNYEDAAIDNPEYDEPMTACVRDRS